MRTLPALCVLLLASGLSYLSAAEGYKLLKTAPVPGEGGWDYLVVDEVGRRVYVSHGNQVDVLDADTYEVKGTLADTKGVHGIALARDLGLGFTSNGGSDSITIFDLKTLEKKGESKTGKNPDCIFYDPATKRVFAFNGGGKSATVIDTKGKVEGTIELPGRPEFATADGAGSVFVNIVDKSTLVRIDAKTMKIVDTWPLAPGENPSGLTMDPKRKRLFVGCRNKKLVVVNAENGKVVANVPIGSGVDATMFDPELKLIFSSCGDGTVAVVHDDGDDKYSVVETIKTKDRARTMALDLKTHKLFLPTRSTTDPKFGVMVFSKAEK